MDFLVVGLGNPGKEYDNTRHNVGFDVINILCARYGVRLSKETSSSLATNALISGHKVMLAQPTTYMNESGIAVGEIMRRYKLTIDQLIVVHDELDLDLGAVKLKKGGGLAGHNGLRSITQHVKSQEYIRVRIGIDKPSHKTQGASHVLRTMSKKERDVIDVACERAADAVEVIIADSLDVAMHQFHTA